MKASNKVFWCVIVAIFVGVFIILLTLRSDIIISDKASNEVNYFFSRFTTGIQIKSSKPHLIRAPDVSVVPQKKSD